MINFFNLNVIKKVIVVNKKNDNMRILCGYVN